MSNQSNKPISEKQRYVYDILFPLAKKIRLGKDPGLKIPKNLHDIYSDVAALDPADQRAIRLRLMMTRHQELKKLKPKPYHRDDHTKPIRFVVFTRPCPFFTLYYDGDEKLEELGPILFDNWHTARKHFSKLKALWITEKWNNPERVSELL